MATYLWILTIMSCIVKISGVDFSDLNVSLCFETIVVQSTLWKLLAVLL